MNSELLKQANNAGYNLRRVLFKKYANIKIEDVLKKEIQTLLRALNDNNRKLFLETIIAIYTDYKIKMPNVFYEIFEDDEHFEKILGQFIFGLKGAYKQPKGRQIVIDGELCYDIKTVCDLLQIHKNSVYRWMREGKLQKANSDNTGRIYIKKSDVDNLLKK